MNYVQPVGIVLRLKGFLLRLSSVKFAQALVLGNTSTGNTYPVSPFELSLLL